MLCAGPQPFTLKVVVHSILLQHARRLRPVHFATAVTRAAAERNVRIYTTEALGMLCAIA